MKKKLARIISLVLCLILASPISAFAQQPTDDYSNHWAGSQIKSFLSKGFIAVDKTGNFKPNEPITRGDFAAITNKAFNLTEMDETGFDDVEPSERYYHDILIAKKAGYLVGQPDGTVMPRGFMSRQEYAVMISRLLKLDMTRYLDTADNFNDASAIPEWSKGAIGAVAKAGYMTGEPGNVFNPTGFITRGQAVAVLERSYLNNVKIAYNKPGTYSANVVEGNVAINVRDVNLENTTITGNLIIGEGVGDGNVKLKNVVVKGDTIVKGGGLNSIVIEDSQIKNIIIIKIDNKVRILALGSTTVESVDMQSGGKLEEQGTTGAGFGYVTIAENVASSEPIILMGNFDTVQILADGVNLDVASGSVTNLDVAQTASNAQISLATGTSVTNMVINSAAVVAGTGTIGTAQVNVQGATITAPTTTTSTAAGVTVATTLPTPAPAPTAAPTPAPATAPAPTPTTPSTGGGSGGGGGGGGGSHDDDDEDNVIYVSAITVTGTGNVSTVTADNGTLQMTAAVTPTNATNRAVTWSVTNGTGSATISNTGLLKAVANGTVTVKATAKDGSGKFGTKEIMISNQVPTIIYTSSTVAMGAANPDIVVKLLNDTFTANGVSTLVGSWVSNAGPTGLTVGTITRNSDTQMTIHMNGTAQPGTLTLKAKAAVLTSGNESNTVTVFVLEAASGAKGTIEPAEGMNGIVDEVEGKPTINGQSITFNGEVEYYLANESNGLPISGNWVGVKITAPEGVIPDENAVLYVNGRNANAGENAGWGNIKEESDGDNYFHFYQRVTDLSRVYNIVIKWNNALTEVYSINFASGAELEGPHGSIERAQGINGGENAIVTTDGKMIKFAGEIAHYTIPDVPKSGNWVGVKITAPEGVMPDDTAWLEVHGNICNLNEEPGWENIREEGDGDNYFHVYQRVAQKAYVYEIKIKWNNDVTETYEILIPGSAVLKYSELGDMLKEANDKYSNAAKYGDTSVDVIKGLGEALDAAQEAYDKAGVAPEEINAVRENLAEALDAFDAYEAEIVVTASPALDEIVANAVYDDSDPLVITLHIDRIGEFSSELADNITFGGALTEMEIKSVTICDPANKAVLELKGTVGDSTGDGNIIIGAAGVNGHDHGFTVVPGKIEQADTAVNGGAGINVVIEGQWIRFYDGEIAYYIADENNGLPENGNYVGVKITAPAGVIPDENAVLTAYGEVLNADGTPGWDNIRKEGDGDNYFYLYQRVTQTAFAYVVEIKWNNDISETYFIHIRATATLNDGE